MKKLEKYKIAPQTKFIKFKGKHFVEIPTIPHDKAVPPLLGYLKSSSSPWMCPYPGSWSLAVAPPPPTWLMTQKSFPPWSGGGDGRGEDTMQKLLKSEKKYFYHTYGSFWAGWKFKNLFSVRSEIVQLVLNRLAANLVVIGTIYCYLQKRNYLKKSTFFVNFWLDFRFRWIFVETALNF